MHSWWQRHLGPLAIVLAIAVIAAACARRVPVEQTIAQPEITDFFRFPHKYRGRAVRLDVIAARVEIGRPLVFFRPSSRDELVLSDARGLARRRALEVGAPVAVVFRCIEGRTDRGNLLIGVE